MMSKAEELAKKYCEGSSFEDACMEKPAYIAGYRQAVKDNELTIDDIMKLDALLIRSWNETKGNPDYEGVLNQFNNERSR